MSDGALPLDLPDDDAVLREIAAMDLALARKHFAAAMAESDPQVSAELGHAYQRVARSLRQSIALRARLAQDAENHRVAHTPIFGRDPVLDAFRRTPQTQPAAPPQPPAEDARVRTRKTQLRCALQTTIWSEREAGERMARLFAPRDHADACDSRRTHRIARGAAATREDHARA